MNLSPEFSKLVEKILRKDSDMTGGEKDLKDYIRLIMVIARSYVRTRVEYEDLVMQGVLGLIRAREKYDPSRSENFKTFASMCILGDIYTYCQNNSHLISVPTHIAKASSYVDKMKKLLEYSPGISLDQSDIQEIIMEYRSEKEEKLEKSTLEKLHNFKDRVASIARNSSLSYEALALLASNALVSTVSDSLLANHQTKKISIEEKACEQELQGHLLESLGKKRYMVLKLHYEGYTNPEIAQILFEHGYTNFSGKPISRSAVKSLLDNSLATVKNMEIFQGVTKNYE